MELDEMKSAWNRLDAELDAAWTRLDLRADGIEALVLQDRRERGIGRGRASLRHFGLAQLVEMAIWIAMVIVAASFWYDHRATPHLLAAGLALHVYGIAAIWSAATRALLAAGVYYTAPVVDIQRRLARLRRFTTVTTVALGLPWLCLWLVATMVGAKLWMGVDLYAAAPGWVVSTLAFGAVAMAGSVWVAVRWSRHPPTRPWLRAMIDDLAGCNLRRAGRQLDEIERFERA
ncbi:hypothetical protein [Lysobacter sp. F6437]|uniref:hypothetical protein n=1 Tax=Lysobacter sp. F6437 TaxID=3459296 RepID=UPI00403E2D27